MAPEFGIFDRPRSAPKKFNTDSAIKIHLTEAEKEKAMKVLTAAKPHGSAIPLVAHAWGVTENTNTLRNWYNSMVYSNGTKVIRKQRAMPERLSLLRIKATIHFHTMLCVREVPPEGKP